MTTTATRIPFVDLTRMHDEVTAELRDAFERVMRQGSFTLGPEVEAFEREFAAFVGVSRSIGVGSGTDALHFALRACGVGAGDEVITAVNTFAATAEAIVMAGARPVFVDIDPDSFLIDLDAVEAAITPRTRAIIPVHLYGQCVDMRRLLRIAQASGLKVVEDACQAHGASRDGIAAGSAGDAGCFSFYPSKNLGAAGDGGIVTTNDPAIADRVRLLRSHGEDGQRLHIEVGYCSRLHGMQAALLRTKLPRLREWNALRAQAADEYRRLLPGDRIALPSVAADGQHVYHLYVVKTRDRDRFRARLAERGVQTAVHYPVPLHLEPAFASLGYTLGDFPQAESVTAQIVSLPMFPHLSTGEVQTVAKAVEEASA